jgi:hypothetical protein
MTPVVTFEITLTFSELCCAEGAIGALVEARILNVSTLGALRRLHTQLENAAVDDLMRQDRGTPETSPDTTEAVPAGT